MNTISDPDDELRCAEYVLGVLDAAERSRLEPRILREPRVASAVAWWQQRLMPLAEDLALVDPPARVWARIEADLGLAASRPSGTGRRWWDSLTLWRWIGIGASVAAVALLAVNLEGVRERQASAGGSAVAGGYLVATLARSDGVAHWTATVDLNRARLVVVPAVRPTVAADRSTELWLIAPHAKPIPLGVFTPDAPATLSLSPDVVARITPQSGLAVSIEPPGGSPTGQPTGPVVATGAMRGT